MGGFSLFAKSSWEQLLLLIPKPQAKVCEALRFVRASDAITVECLLSQQTQKLARKAAIFQVL